MNERPPQWIEEWLKRVIDQKLFESVSGDLQEKFERRLYQKTPLPIAQLLYLSEALGFMRLKTKKSNSSSNPITMYKHYLKVAIRNLGRNKLSSFINIIGLSAGITSVVLIALWVIREISYDQFHPNVESLHQVWVNVFVDGGIRSNPAMPIPLYEVLKNSDANIKRASISNRADEIIVAVDDKKFTKKGKFVSREFLEMFPFAVASGLTSNALADPSSMVITESLAKALFGDIDPVGQSIRVNNGDNHIVQAVLRDLPENSSFEFDCLVPFEALEREPWVRRAKNNWDFSAFVIYLELNDPGQKGSVEAGIKDLLASKSQNGPKKELFLHPMTRWHLYSRFENGKEAGGIIDYVTVFSCVALVILVMACSNFINLATAQSERKIKETGIRKSIGSGRSQLIGQFLAESFLMVCIAVLLSTIAVEFSLPSYNRLLGKSLFIDYGSPSFWISALALTGVVGIISGFYPAFYLSSFNPIKGLRNKGTANGRTANFKKVMIVFQCTSSIFLVSGAIIFHQQISLLKSRDIGYNKENLITITATGQIDSSYHTIKTELIRSGAAQAVTRSNSAITDIQATNLLHWPGRLPEQRVAFTTITTEYDYAKTLGTKMFLGRDFSEEFPGDTSAIIVNKAGLDAMNLKDPLGTVLQLNSTSYTLIGVLPDIVMGSAYHDVQPMCMIMNDWVSAVTVRLSEGVPPGESLKTVEAIVQKYNTENAFEYQFVDQEFDKKFASINLIITLSNLFCLLAILISSLGLIGLAAFTAERRTKEIGIRKVLGARIHSIIMMIAGDFGRLVLVAFVLATPMTWYLLTNFLLRYPIRISISWWVYGLSGALIFFLTILICAVQSYKAASANPVKSLKILE